MPSQRIRQLELFDLQTLRDRGEQMDKELALLNAELAAKEADLIKRLQGGAGVEAGALLAEIVKETFSAKCSPPWKPIYLAHMLAEHGISNDIAEQQQRALHPAGPGRIQQKLSIVPRTIQ